MTKHNRTTRTFRRLGTAALAASFALLPAFSAFAADTGAGQTVSPATTLALENGDIIDTSRTGSLTIHKYDITAAEAAGDYEQGRYQATGEEDSRVESELSDYAIQGVQFSYLRVGDVETSSRKEEGKQSVTLVYELPVDLAAILGLSASDAVDMSAAEEAFPCSHTGVYHFTGQQVSDALAQLLSQDNVEAKNQLENYLYDYGTESSSSDGSLKNGAANMALTDEKGYTCAENLELGLYLLVETEVPENVTDTVNPWFVQLPFTDADGEQWLYDMTCYPKNQTGNPTLDKSVRNTFSESDRQAAANITASDRDYTFGDTATASAGDQLDYILVSHLPHIASSATYLSTYTFVDQLSRGLSYNRDVTLAFYHSAEDANANDLSAADQIWEAEDGMFTQTYQENADGSTSMTLELTEAGLAAVNGSAKDSEGYSDYYLVASYTATVHTDETLVLGDEGNPNDVRLIWSRTSDSYYNELEDRNYVYTYGLDLTKEFSDGNGDFSEVQFNLYNETDGYYVIADRAEDGIYHITGKTSDGSQATLLTPAQKDGSLWVYGLEGDTWQLTETATDDGYSLLKQPVQITIQAADREVIASVCGTTGLDQDAVDAIVHNYGGGIYEENGSLVTESIDELTQTAASSPAEETANGRTIGKTDLYIGAVQHGSATVDGLEATMISDDTSEYASVKLTITNTKGFELPKTGGSGLYLVTILGMVSAAGGCLLSAGGRRKAKKSR